MLASIFQNYENYIELSQDQGGKVALEFNRPKFLDDHSGEVKAFSAQFFCTQAWDIYL